MIDWIVSGNESHRPALLSKRCAIKIAFPSACLSVGGVVEL